MFAVVVPGTVISEAIGLPVVRAGLIDLDWTVFVQFGLFTTLVVLLPRLVFNPMLRRVEERQARTSGAAADARAIVKEADRKVGQYEDAIAEEKRQAMEERAHARDAARRKAAATVAQVRKEADARIEAGIATLQVDAEAARAGLRDDARAVADMIADRLVGERA